jgi:N-acetylglucosaminyldiphosphoundecaprenol N-acetyl-beta-D-mannosaminyltransferase
MLTSVVAAGHATAATRHRTWPLLGVNLAGARISEIVDECLRPRQPDTGPFTVACANLHCLVVAARDSEFAAALTSASCVTADGAPLLLAGRLLGEAVGARITGADLFAAVMAALDRAGGRAFFVGSTPAVLDKIRQRAAREFPAVKLEALSPPFGELSAQQNDAIVRAANAFRPDVIWVGMSAPKQEKWVARNSSALGARSVISIGAVFDFYAGTVPRAPAWMRRIGFEWLHRLVHEPRRLWRRYLVSGPVFVALVWRYRRLRRQSG